MSGMPAPEPQNTPRLEVSGESFDKQFNLNAKGTFFNVQKVLPLLREQASIIMTGTIATIKGMPNLSAYGASKARLLIYAKAWTNKLKARGICVNVLSPGLIETAAFAGREEMKQQLSSQIPMGRIGQPEEIATTPLFLASADSSFITGSELCGWRYGTGIVSHFCKINIIKINCKDFITPTTNQ
jgi:NAD(P)-dependent dehydrogenase (short-subunit alcohol dehydrogenase family)